MLRFISNKIVNGTVKRNCISFNSFRYIKHQPFINENSALWTNCGVRNYNSIQTTVNNFDKLELSNRKQYKELIDKHHDDLISNKDSEIETDIESIYELSTKLISKIQSDKDEILENDIKNELLNNLIVKFTKFDYAIPTIVLKELEKNEFGNVSYESVVEIIKYNPGRVSSSWELFKKYLPVLGGEIRMKSSPKSRKKAMLDEIYGKGGIKNVENDKVGIKDELVIEVLKKLIYGDLIDIKDGNEKIDLDRASKILEIYPELNNKQLIDSEMLKKLVIDFIELGISKGLVGIEINEEIFKNVINEVKELKNSDYLYLFNALGVEIKDEELLIKLLEPISKLSLLNELKDSENYQKLEKSDEFFIISPKESINLILKIIQEFKLDDKSQLIRLLMLKTIGFYNKDLDSTLKLFSKYQLQVSQESIEFQQLQSLMSLILIHNSIANNINSELIDIAEALIPQIPTPSANNLSSLVLYHSWFGNSDKGLDIYNKSLDLYMKPEQTKERLMLIESLILTSLIGKDLELGQFIKLKIKEAKLIDEVGEIKITEIFKEYGEIVENSNKDDSKLRKSMKDLVLRSIIGFSP